MYYLPLAVYCANRHGPVVFADFGELWYVSGNTPIVVLLASKVDLGQFLAKILQLE